MRKFFICALILALSVGCELTPEQKAENAIKEYMVEHLNNPDAYEPLYFGQLDTVYTNFDSIYDEKYKEYRTAKEEYDRYQEYINDGFESIAQMYKKDALKAKKKIKELQQYADSVESAFKPSPLYFRMFHSYRGENKFGAIVKEDHIFKITLDYSRARVEF